MRRMSSIIALDVKINRMEIQFGNAKNVNVSIARVVAQILEPAQIVLAIV